MLPPHGQPDAEARIVWTASIDEIKSFRVTNRASVVIAHLFCDDHATTIIKIINIIPLFFIYFTANACGYVSLIAHMHIQPLSDNVAAE